MNLDQGKELINLARESILCFFSGKAVDINEKIKKKFSKKQGVFVTLKKLGELRGCIGFPEPVYQLYEAVVKAARSAAFQDPRFLPLDKEELSDISIEISVLTVPEQIKVKNTDEYPKKIQIGFDGLIIKSTFGSGLLLPQVFPEYNADAKKALEMTCQKASLPKDYWKNKDVKIYKFQAQIFAEEDGNIIEKEF